MSTFVPPRLPVLSEPDNTLNWEALMTFLETFEGAGGFSDTVAIAYRSTEKKVPRETFTNVEPNKAIYDPEGLITAGSYNVPADGIYHVDGNANFTEIAAKNLTICSIFVSKTEMIRGGRDIAPEANLPGYMSAGLVQCKTGETIELTVWHNNLAEIKLETGSHLNRLSVFRVS